MACASASPVAANPAASAVALSSIAARGVADDGSPATPRAALKKLVIRVPRSAPVSADWMRSSQTDPAAVRARSAPALRTAAERNMSAARDVPDTMTP